MTDEPNLGLPRLPEDSSQASSFVYVIGTATQRGYKTYVGWTIDPDRRLQQHNAGAGAKSTRGQTWSLLYVEGCASRSAAMSREWHLKRDRCFRKELALAAQSVGNVTG